MKKVKPEKIAPHTETVAVAADEYRYPPGSSWAEPDLEHASSILRSAVGQPDVTAAKVRRARRVAARAAAVHDLVVATLGVSASSYQTTEAANAVAAG